MGGSVRFGGRELDPAEIASIRQLIRVHPQANRTALARLACRAGNWRQPNGELRVRCVRDRPIKPGWPSPASAYRPSRARLESSRQTPDGEIRHAPAVLQPQSPIERLAEPLLPCPNETVMRL